MARSQTRYWRPILLLLAAVVSACANVGVIGGAYYAPEYSWSEFFAATDGRNFQVIVSGNPFPNLSEAEFKRRLLPVMQANKPRPNLTFTYEPPPEPPRPDYRLVLVFNAANDLTAEMHKHAPGSSITLTWLDQSGRSHTGTAKLVAGPAD